MADSPDGITRLAYGAVTSADRAALDAYVDLLEEATPSLMGRDDALAYWINLYNAVTVQVILDHYPVPSIRRIKYGNPFALGPWGRDLVTVEGTDLSLDDIEHEIIRPVFHDPRIHYGVNCASIGCPNLAGEPYEGATIDPQLTEAARLYVNHPRGVTVREGRLRVSSIYVWFDEDFGGRPAGVIEHLRQYAEGDLARELEGIDRIAGNDYDWSLNDQVSE